MTITMIEELKRLEAEATPAPWDVSGLTVYDTCMDSVASTHSAADAALIVAMRNALPELLKALEEVQERSAVMENALTNISMMHDANPPAPLADMPEVDYARRVIRTMRLVARDALPPHGGVDV